MNAATGPLTRAAKDAAAWIGSIGQAAVDYVRDSVERRRVSEEITGIGACDLDRLLAELGCTRSDLDGLIRNAPYSRSLLDRMILRLDLERALMGASPELVREIERRCATCPSPAECKRWLRGQLDPNGYRRFCPNAANFDLLPEDSKTLLKRPEAQ